MGRKGKTTIFGTTTSNLYSKLIEKYIEEKGDILRLKQISPSKAKVVELAILKFLEIQGVLEPYLKEFGLTDSEVKSIKEHLKVVL